MHVSTSILRLGDRLGRYSIRRALGTGGHACVYLAEDMETHGQVAIKASPYHSLLLDEGWLLTQLNHPMIPKISDALWSSTGIVCLVLEYFEAITLEQFLTCYPRGAFPPQAVLAIGLQLCQVLEYLHTRQPVIAHGDIKPSNVMLTAESDVKLIDFGIATCQDTPILSRQGERIGLGTPGFTAPEVCQGREATTLSDIYSLGVTLRHLVTGDEPPTEGGSSLLHLLDSPLGTFIARMISADPLERPQHISEVAENLTSLLSAGKEHTPMDTERGEA